jgi:hypothetical protein
MTENGAEHDADGQYPTGDPDKFPLARRKLDRSSPQRKVLGDRNGPGSNIARRDSCAGVIPAMISLRC